jgi:D-alanyl-lipoteichoic acid acyltransferase DltB (MBOAT superfamily)
MVVPHRALGAATIHGDIRAALGSADERTEASVERVAHNVALRESRVLGFFQVCGISATIRFHTALSWFGPWLTSKATLSIFSGTYGISFYTFQSMSYSIDVLPAPARTGAELPRPRVFHLVFPQLVAGRSSAR